MRNYYIFGTIILFLILLNLVLLYRLNDINHSRNFITNNVEDETNIGLLEDIYKAQIESNGFQISNTVKFKNSQNETKYLIDILSNGPKLFFNYTNYSCKTCVDEELLRLESLKPLIGDSNIICIASFESSRQRYVLYNKYGIEFYSIEDEGFGLPIDSKLFPYIFVADTTMLVSNIYIPTKDFYNLGDIYYTEVIARYFK